MIRNRLAGLLAAIGLALVAQMAHAGPAAAHAEVVDTSPRAGTGLPQAPGAVVIKFTEPLNLRLSRIEVIDEGGVDVGQGGTIPVPGDPQASQRKLGLLRPGAYTVRWTTVSRLDGHTLRGRYGFGVGVGGSPEEAVAANPVDSEGPVGLAGRFLALAGLALWAGSVVTRRVAMRSGVPRSRLARLRALGPRLALIGTALSLLSSAAVASGSLAALPDVVFASPSGRFRLALLAAAAFAVAPPGRRLVVSSLLAGVAVVAEAASGHAASSPAPVPAVASFALHLVAVGVWLFAIAASAASGRALVAALRAFSPYAVAAAGVVGTTGVVNAALGLSHPGDLVSTGYGRTVLAKAGAFGAMAGLGLLHRARRRRPRPDVGTLRRPLRLELGVGVAVLGLATLLVGFPNPPREAEASARLLGADPVLGELAGRPALSVAEPSGPFIVGLTVLPPRPGPVEVRLQVAGAKPGDGLRDARVRATGPGTEVTEIALSPCGSTCFAGRGRLLGEGRWRLEAAVASNRQPIRILAEVPLPAPDGSAELERARRAMESLRSARMREQLRGEEGGELLESDYQFAAPDALAFELRGSKQVRIGRRNFSQPGPGAEWAVSEGPVPLTWPHDYYRDFWGQRAAARILSTEEVDGVPSRVIAFLRPELPAWFRVWVGIHDGFVRRQEMLTEGHLMDHTYRDFDEPFRIDPPT
jgi:copper transport protein